jgi:hypothetical protein
MKTLFINIDLENSCFYDAEGSFNPKPEVTRILHTLIKSQLYHDCNIIDVNGNSVGKCKITL